MQEEGDML